jgi:CRISPR-associated exonuclease Cas4
MKTYLNVTNVVENAFCPKFTYYELVLGLKQHEEKQGSVQAGRKFHHQHSSTNIRYIPKNLKGRKMTEVQLFSKTHLYSGKIDEAIETNEEVILIERKYSEHLEVGDTLKVQLGLLAILTEENMRKKVKKAIVIFSKKRRTEIQVNVTDEVKNSALVMLERTKQILTSGISPPTNYSKRCQACCYKNICPVGSLKISQEKDRSNTTRSTGCLYTSE